MIRYSDLRAYKYRLLETYEAYVGLFPQGPDIYTDFVQLDRTGILKIRAGYCWDGPSGPTIDTKSFMRGSLVHDALYQLIRKGLLPAERKGRADDILKRICLEDGMNPLRAGWVHLALMMFGSRRTQPLPEDKNRVLEAP